MKHFAYILLSTLWIIINFSCSSTMPVNKKLTNMTEIDINKMPEAKPAPKIHFQNPNVYQLKNGLTLIIVENHKLPRVNASLQFDNPPFNLKNKKGSDDLLSSLLGTGSINISKNQFNSRIDFLGAYVNLHKNGFSINSLSKYFYEVLQLTSDQILYPKFTEKEFKIEQEKLIESLKSNEKSTPEAASRVMKKLSYGEHPYGEITLIENVKKLNLKDIINYYQKVFKPNNAYLIVVGDVNSNELKEKTEQYFGSWQKINTEKKSSLSQIKNVDKTEVDFIHMPNAEQSELKLAHRSDIRRNNPDYQKVLLMNSILGGDFNSYLNMTLREEHGWTYGASSIFGTNKYGALFTAGASVRNTVADSAISVSLEQINKIINEKVNDILLQNNKQKYMGNFVLSMEKPSTIAHQAYLIFVDNLPKDYYETFLQKIDAVTVEDIQKVARKYLHPDQMRIVVAGNANQTVPKLKKAGYLVKFYDKYGNPTEAPKINQKIPEGINVKTIIDKYLKEIGIKNKINEIKSLETVYITKMQGIELTSTSKALKPNLSANIISGMGMILGKEIFNGENGYKENQGKKINMTNEEIKKHKNIPQPFPSIGLIETGKLDRVENINDKNYYVIINTIDNTEHFFDIQTGLQTKEVKHQKIQGKEIVQTVIFSNYKEIEGIKLPEKIILKTGGQNMEFKLKNAKINTLTTKDFQ